MTPQERLQMMIDERLRNKRRLEIEIKDLCDELAEYNNQPPTRKR